MTQDWILDEVVRIARLAGQEILEVYASNALAVEYKRDSSPLTEADRRANDLIVNELSRITPDVPILSEESAQVPFGIRKEWSRFWLVDPLDGTREFIKRNGEFTVNIALIENNRPVLGVVQVPVTDQCYVGCMSNSDGRRMAWKQTGTSERQAIHARSMASDKKLIRVVASRSHRDARLDALLERFKGAFEQIETTSMGSSLKICLLAEGKADIYPRLAPTSEWDTAAAHAVLLAAGGNIVDTAFHELLYNRKADLLNPDFIALADTSFHWQTYFSA